MSSYFCGWYYRCQTDQQTIAIIPSIHKTTETTFCAIQLITDKDSFYLQYPYSDYQKNGCHIRIAENHFSPEGISLDIHTPELRAVGSVCFGPFTPIRYDIMGPFRFVPFLQCRHSVYSMRHSVNGEMTINGITYSFINGLGYLEGDRGASFPREYAWTYCSFPEGAIMLSTADIPLNRFHFTGVIGVVLLQGKEYRLATYLGARAVRINRCELTIRQGNYRLTVQQRDAPGHPLRAPATGAMTRTIYEHPACRVYYRFEFDGTTLLEYEANNAAFEYEY